MIEEMGFTEKQQEAAFEEIFERITNGESLRKILLGEVPSKVRLPKWVTFFEWIEASETRANQYVRAMEMRQWFYADLMLKIAFELGTSETIVYDAAGKVVTRTVTDDVKQRRLQIDTIDRVRARLAPKAAVKERGPETEQMYDEEYV